MGRSRLASLAEAIDRYVTDGCSVAMCTCYESMIPFAAGQEIIRQRKKNLTLIGPISDILFDQLVGAGCVDRIQAAWVGNVITGSGYNFRRAVEGGTLGVEDHSNYTMSLALQAGAMGVPFLPTRTALGSDLFKTNNGITRFDCPVSGDRLTAVKAITPDVAIVHLQRADCNGNSHIWGNLGITREACLASNSIVVTAEEIVPKSMITSDPGRIVFPGFLVSAVIHVPWGGYPSPVPGYYNRDHDVFLDYRNRTRTPEGTRSWIAETVDGKIDWAAQMAVVPDERRRALKLSTSVLSQEADYGY